MGRSILVRSGGKADSEERSQSIVPIFPVRGQQANLRQERKITEPIVQVWLMMNEVGRQVDADFQTIDRNRGEALAAPVVCGCGPVDISLPRDVVTEVSQFGWLSCALRARSSQCTRNE